MEQSDIKVGENYSNGKPDDSARYVERHVEKIIGNSIIYLEIVGLRYAERKTVKMQSFVKWAKDHIVS